MNNAESGINKRVSESVYPSDILGDKDIATCSMETRCAWYETLLYMWRDKVAEITTDVQGWASLWRCSTEQAQQCLSELGRRKPCDVTLCHENITLMSRRLKRREKSRKQAASRQAKHRGNANVTSKKPLSSSSSSSSTIVGEKTEASSKPLEKTQAMLQVEAWFGRRITTRWSNKELKAWRKVGDPPPDLDVIAPYYTARLPKESDFRRRDLVTLLNNWTGEADRARKWKTQKHTVVW